MPNKTYVIAEMACSHEGEVELAKKIIDASAFAEADAVQLQIWNHKYMISPNRKEYSLLKDIELNKEEWIDIVDYSKKNHPNIDLIVCAYEHHSIDFINTLNINGFKLNSSDLSNPLILEKVAETKKTINLSVGASSIEEIQKALEIISRKNGGKVNLMYGFQNFPTKPEEVNLSFMRKISKLFELPIGYQDHSDAEEASAFWLPAMSLGLGASIIEKHITHDRSLKGIDHESALDPVEFVDFVKMVRMLDKAFGEAKPRSFSKSEIVYRNFQKKSLVATRNLMKGEKLMEIDTAFMRSNKIGIKPIDSKDYFGKSLVNDIKAYDSICNEDLV